MNYSLKFIFQRTCSSEIENLDEKKIKFQAHLNIIQAQTLLCVRLR